MDDEEDFLGFFEDHFECLVERKYNFSHVKVEAFNTNSGPCHRLCPQKFFRPFFGDDFLDIVVQATIFVYANQQFSTNRAEMSAFFGLNILMGINQLSNKSCTGTMDNISITQHDEAN